MLLLTAAIVFNRAVGKAYPAVTASPQEPATRPLSFLDVRPTDVETVLRQRSHLLQRELPAATETRSWSVPRVQAGTDFTLAGKPVEIWLRQTAHVIEQAHALISGKIGREFITWTPNGFWTHCVLADLASITISKDDLGDIIKLHTRLLDYPSALKDALCLAGFASADFWRDNVHLETALERKDQFYLASIHHQIKTDLVQALFAINQTYYPGDKKLHQWFERLPSLPDDFEIRWRQLGGTVSLDPPGWRDEFKMLFSLVDEVRALQS